MPDFEYDAAKSASNKDKHGIDFDEAKALWNDENRIILDTAFVVEKRFLTVGLIDGRMWTAVYTQRRERFRLISVRRSRNDEIKVYEDNLRG